MEVRVSAHCAYRSQGHVVWVCKYRHSILKLGVEIETIGYDGDPLHMVMIIPPKYSISEVMGRLRSQSLSRLRKKFQWLSKVYWSDNIVWSPGYFVSSVGVDERTIKKYVEYQGRQDSGQHREVL